MCRRCNILTKLETFEIATQGGYEPSTNHNSVVMERYHSSGVWLTWNQITLAAVIVGGDMGDKIENLATFSTAFKTSAPLDSLFGFQSDNVIVEANLTDWKN